MTRRKKALAAGGLIILTGSALFIYAAYLLPVYAGYSGAGLSGLPAAFMLMAALALIGLGAIVVLAALIATLLRAQKRA